MATQVLESSSDGTLTHPALLKDRVASPAGTTIAGMQLPAQLPRGVIRRCAVTADHVMVHGLVNLKLLRVQSPITPRGLRGVFLVQG